MWRDSREAFVRERAYGLPLVVETQPRLDYQRMKAEKQEVLLALPDNTDGKVVFDFTQSPLGDKLLQLQNDDWARGVMNLFTNELDAFVMAKRMELGAAVRAALADVPAPSDKTYLGTVTMTADKTFTVVVEHRRYLSLAGTSKLVYASGDLHWGDIAAAVPTIKAGETRYLYRDGSGRLGDRP